MRRFLAIYTGTEAALDRARWNELGEEERKAIQAEGFQAWIGWSRANAASIVDPGSPLGKTKRVAREGVSEFRNSVVGYVIVEAETHEAAARLFENHPHFAIFPGDSVEITECLPLPER